MAESEFYLGLIISEITLSLLKSTSEQTNLESEIETFMLELSDERDIILPSNYASA